MTPDQRFTLILFTISVLVLPALALLVRLLMKWSKMESQMNELVKDMTEIARSTDSRLRYLEENQWKPQRR